jgi:uncharacterized membrane protein
MKLKGDVMTAAVSKNILIALFFNVVSILLAASACIYSVIFTNLQNEALKIESILSTAVILILAYIANIIAAYFYKQFFSQNQKYQKASKLIFAGAIMSIVPVGEALILVGWLLVALNFLMHR